MRCFVSRFNTRDSSILQLFDQHSTLEFVNVGQELRTEDALLLMDQEVAGLEAYEPSLLIDFDAGGFALFYVTFTGALYLKEPGATRQFKLSFMTEGKVVRESLLGETVVTVKAAKMDIM